MRAFATSQNSSSANTAAGPVVADGSSRQGRALLPILIYIGMLTAAIGSLGAPLIPTVARHFHVSFATAQWSLTISLLAGAVTAPIIGRLGDGPRRRPVLIGSLLGVALGGLLCAIPSGFAGLLVGRALQGIGLGMLPLVMGVARDHLPREQARSAIATLSVTTVAGAGLGYPLAAIVTEHLGFRFAFVLAAILNVIAAGLAAVVVPPSTHRPRNRFDFGGAALLVLGTGGLVLGISQSDKWGFGSTLLWVEVSASLVVLCAWAWVETHVEHPLINLRLSSQRAVLAVNLSGLLAGVGMYEMVSLALQFIQTPNPPSYGLNQTIVVAGLAMLPLSIISFTSARLVDWASRWLTAIRILPIGIAIIGVSQLLFAVARDELWQNFVVTGVLGLGIGCSFAVMPRVIVRWVPPEETSSALALNQVLRTIGYSVGSAVGAAVLSAHEHGGAFPTDSGYTVGALIGVGMSTLTVIIAMILPGRERSRAAVPAATGLQDEGTLEVESIESAVSGALIYEPRREHRESNP